MTVMQATQSPAISLETAAIITERSRRTWQRRLADGGVDRVAEDARGRSMLQLRDVLPLVCVPLGPEEQQILALADDGSASAQRDIGQVFDLYGKHEIAIHWWRQASEQGDADAMQCLGSAHAEGRGTPKDQNLGLMWIARAAAAGHVIAAEQVRGLLL
ncbi:MAG: sel1 repeat family protein [Cytophagaceae bacterium]|nr:MAG: sel1 repeat family protein [Cytophagaceae bacterium]